LDEVTSIVEYPHALLARFDMHFLEVPAEALIAAMQVHQKCFALRDNIGQLLPCFITVANIESLDPERVILGNEKVMRARLSDARFFYDKDRRHGLSHYAEATKSVVYQAQLGSLADKAKRLQGILETSLVLPLKLQMTDVLRAASLSQCDLMTGMVGEFPELQGLMGYYYALHDGEAVPVATALKEQYMPRFSGDTLPSSPLGLALSIADRMDTLVGAFAIGQKPTGVKDPFKLRRHAIALARLLIETQTPISLADLIQSTKAQYSQHLKSLDTVDTLLPVFILERLHAFYQAQGVPVACVDAARARQEDCLFDLDQRIQALVQFMQLPEAQSLAAASKRVNNLLQHATLPLETATIDPDLLLEQAEKSLFERILTIEKLILPAYEHRQYTSILKHLASLRGVVDVFFEEVLVLDKNLDLQQNRLALLKRLQTILQGVAVIAML
jgi:glycyl-tRNA synthetase beta chain